MVLSRVVSIFLLMAVGYLARRARVIEAQGIKTISSIVLNVTLPFTILFSFDRSIPFSAAADLVRMAIFSLAIHGLLAAATRFAYGRLMFRAEPLSSRKILAYITIFSNCGFMGFPVTESVFGKIGVMYASIYVIIFNIFVWTYGVALLAGSETARPPLKAIVLNPGNIAVVAGLALWLAPFQLPETITYAFNLVANCTTPLSMIVVGATLGGLPLKGLFKGTEVWIGTIIRLALVPAVIWLLFQAFGQYGMAARVAVFLTAMPAAAQTVIFAERYEADIALASRIVFISTVLSVLTIPIAAQLL
ncbi:MAG: AEC family transporter [Rectinemataceae bacterium]|nr:AEC family transporter [Spirochaetaceae bacterium]